MRASLWFYLVLLPTVGFTQIITTVAGTGVDGHFGDYGLATNAHISNPIVGGFDSKGNLYFVQFGGQGNRVSKIDTLGIITTVAGDGYPGHNGDNISATLAELFSPSSVIVDFNDNLIICDHDNNRIRKVDLNTGIINTIAGNGTGGFAGDNGPATNAELKGPADICIDTFGNLYIGDINNVRVRKINSEGIITTIAGNGSFGYSGDNAPATLCQIAPSGICVDRKGNLFIADATTGEQRIAKLNLLTGIISTIAGTDTGFLYNGDNRTATSANINPSRIRFDNEFKNLYFTDVLNNRIRMVDSSGIIHNVAGTGVSGFSGDGNLALMADLHYPSGLIFDACGNMLFGDSNNNRIRKISFNPYCWPQEVPKIKTTNYKLYPNPANGEICVADAKGGETYTIVNPVGGTEQTGLLSEGTNQLPIEHLPPGLKILQVVAKDGERRVMKFIKE